MSVVASSIVAPERVWSRAEFLNRPCPVPARPGVYGWYFRELPTPPDLDVSSCVEHDGLRLLYVGTAPKEPPKNGRPPSTRNLRMRIRDHYARNASGSALRLTLGCLLAEQLALQLRRVGRTERLTFSTGEQRLSEWMGRNAFVTWFEHPEPWRAELDLLRSLDLPLNLRDNQHHRFAVRLSKARADARAAARALPVLAR